MRTGTWTERPLASEELSFITGPDRAGCKVAQVRGNGEWHDTTLAAPSALLDRLGLHGWGLYAAKQLKGPSFKGLRFRPGESFGHYTGKVLAGPLPPTDPLLPQSAERAAGAGKRHLMFIKAEGSDWYLIDGADAGAPFIHCMNDDRGECTNNARIEQSGLARVTKTVQAAPLRTATSLQELANSELLVHYGEGFWKRRDGRPPHPGAGIARLQRGLNVGAARPAPPARGSNTEELCMLCGDRWPVGPFRARRRC